MHRHVINTQDPQFRGYLMRKPHFLCKGLKSRGLTSHSQRVNLSGHLYSFPPKTLDRTGRAVLFHSHYNSEVFIDLPVNLTASLS